MISLHEIASAFSKPSEHRFASLFQSNPVQNKLLGFFLFRLLFCFRLYLFDTLWIILSLYISSKQGFSLTYHFAMLRIGSICHSVPYQASLEVPSWHLCIATRCKIYFLNFQGCITVYLSRFFSVSLCRCCVVCTAATVSILSLWLYIVNTFFKKNQKLFLFFFQRLFISHKCP